MDTRDITVPFASSCRFLNDKGCVLGGLKPFQCRLYPLLFLYDGSLGVDPACTFSEEYLAQLKIAGSDARLHLDAMKKEASRLTEKEILALADWSRYVCDVIRLDTGAGDKL